MAKEDTIETEDGDSLEFAVTGALSYFKNLEELNATIKGIGGSVTDRISNNTDYLICNDPDRETVKSKKARELGVTVITEKEFLEMAKSGDRP